MMPREYKLKIRTFHSYVYFLFLGSSYTRPGRGEGTCFSPSQNMQVSCEHFHSYRIYQTQNLQFNQFKFCSPFGMSGWTLKERKNQRENTKFGFSDLSCIFLKKCTDQLHSSILKINYDALFSERNFYLIYFH